MENEEAQTLEEIRKEMADINKAIDLMWEENKAQLYNQLPLGAKPMFKRMEKAFKQIYSTGFYNGGWYYENQTKRDL